jgi:large subunit ribosomal protein L29
MDAKTVRAMSDKELLDTLEDQKESLFKLRFQSASGQLEDPNSLIRTRRDIARIKTILRERALAAEQVSREQK